MFTHSKISFNTWSAFIACELKGLSLEQDSVAIGLPVTTCFHMRHKLYKAISKVNDNVILHCFIKLDSAYTKINLKGTSPQNMSRSSKHRGRKNTSIYSRHLRGLSNHKVCLATATDKNYNILVYSRYQELDKKVTINTTSSENSVSSVSELYTEAKEMIRHNKGISTRHLQAYLDWLVFRKRLRYTLDIRKRKDETYMDMMREKIPFINTEIVKLPQPIDLYKAYGAYHFGIY